MSLLCTPISLILSFIIHRKINLHFRNKCYQFRVPRNLRIDIKDRLEEYSQSIEIDIHDCTQSQKSLIYVQILDDCYNVTLAYKGIN